MGGGGGTEGIFDGQELGPDSALLGSGGGSGGPKVAEFLIGEVDMESTIRAEEPVFGNGGGGGGTEDLIPGDGDVPE